LWYMMINHNNTYISFLLFACFGCCEKQIIPLQRCIENIIMYFSIPLQRFFANPKHVACNKLIQMYLWWTVCRSHCVWAGTVTLLYILTQ
jgi:hypothetical protein